MITSTGGDGGLGWGGVLCWDGVSGCRVCDGVDKDWGGGRVLGDIGWDLGGELNWVGGGSCLWSGVGGELGGVGRLE